MPAKIIDQFTELPVSRQRKHQLRHPEFLKELQSTYRNTPKGREVDRKSSARGRVNNLEYYREYSKQHYVKSMLSLL